ncbi:HigA family addiction module antidote protein [Pseudonocardia sp. MCCB 268]|nr:HigA family addiction module antidote protein [Pseudonocardia cytotoxica]
MDTIAPSTPGEILAEQYLEPLGLSQYALARRSRRPHADRKAHRQNLPQAVTADTALRLGRYFGTTAQYWLNLQAHYDLVTAERSGRSRVDPAARRE